MIHAILLSLRDFRNNLLINIINLSGLSFSIAVVLMLTAFCYKEFTTDWHQDDIERTFIIDGNTPAILAEHIISEIPEVEDVIRIGGTFDTPVINKDDGSNFETQLIFVDENFFDFFKYKFIKGNVDKSLSSPMSLILVEEESIRLFGTTDVVGKTVRINNEHDVIVSAVIANQDKSTFLTFSSILPISGRSRVMGSEMEMTSWSYWNFSTFIRFRTSIGLNGMGEKIGNILVSNSNNKLGNINISFTKIDDIYFSKKNNSFSTQIRKGDLTKISILFTVSILILVIALINYVNIFSISLISRKKQTSILKIYGACNSYILRKFVLESLFLFFVSFCFAVLIIRIFQSSINLLLGENIVEFILQRPVFLVISLAFALLIGFIINIGPIFKHTFYSPVLGIGQTKKWIGQGKSFRGGLVVFQYFCALFLISFTLLINRQIEYGHTELGYNEKNIVVIVLTKQMDKDVLKKELGNISSVRNVSLTQYCPGKRISKWTGIPLFDKFESKDVWFNIFDADRAFIDIMDLELSEGRFYTDTSASDRNKILINETFVKKYTIDNPLEVPISEIMGEGFEIVGVIKDFQYMSKHHEIGPLLIRNTGNAFYCFVEIYSNTFADLQSSLRHINEVNANLSPDFPVEVSFLEEEVDNMYKSEEEFQKIFTFFAICAIFICCLGILALSLHISQERVKEIGIRKVNGASTIDILVLLNRNIFRWICMAFLLSLPVSIYSINKWLESFVYKTKLDWKLFIFSLGLVLVISFLTICWQSYNAAKQNPVKVLRHE